MSLAPLLEPDEDYVDLPQRIRDNARQRPDAVALIDGETILTARALAEGMDRVASVLAEDGIGAGDVVASIAGVTADHVTLYLATLAARAVFAPLAGSAHPDALWRMIQNSGAKAVFTDTDIAVDGVQPLSSLASRAKAAAPIQAATIRPDALFDILYSSGTTGDPKGIEHDALFRDRQVRRLAGQGLGPGATFLAATPVYSNTTIAALLPALGLGACVVLMRKFEERAWLSLAETHRVTHTMLVPVQIRRLMACPDFDRYDLSAFQVKLSTSAMLSPGLVQAVLARWPGRMVNIYGMTEGGVSAYLDCGAHPDKLHTVGQPIAGAEIRIIDADQCEVPQGKTGEIVGRSPTIMRGYRGDPAATDRATWWSPENLPYIRTGDTGFLDPDGFLVLRDRMKDVIISGGFNIYASDLEAVLAAHPLVKECAVVGAACERWGETPVAFAVCQEGGESQDILNWTNDRLGRTQRLADLRIVEKLPRNDIGKVLKRALKDRWAKEQEARDHV